LNDLALYRKYRSASFEAVVGQPHVIQTLKNAVVGGRLSHAYLFTGPRGVGKTSVARLLARAANCTAEAPAKRPCGECLNCKAEIGSHLDLIEIDAASNRGIDDARALREKISSAPSMGRYKVYIIDEAHMLTTEAFNALLKTLEEPPAHAIFILATTEAHKLPETIISRTQRFSFKPIGKADIVSHLRFIAGAEKIEIEDGALELIAAASYGGFRDAISLLDQAAASGAQPLTTLMVRQLLGQSDPELLERIITAVSSHDASEALRAVDAVLEQGVQAGQLASQLLEHWRKLLQDRVATEPDNVAAIQLAVTAVELLMPVLKSSWPELSLEAVLVRLATGLMPIAATAPVVAAAAVTASAPAIPTKSTVPAKPTYSEVPSQDLWLKALSQIKQRNNSLYALLRSSVTTRFEGDDLMLGCRFGFHRDRLKEDKNLQVIEQALSRTYGRKMRVLVQLETMAPPVSSVDNSAELVTSALEILGGEVVHE
jgi:DNA polymerase III subunit gamma/tau